MKLPRAGTEPLQARSAHRLRQVLAVAALAGGGVGAAFFGYAASRPGGTETGEAAVAVLCLAVAVTAVVDLLVLWRRRRR